MKRRIAVGLATALCLMPAAASWAQDMPPIRSSERNPVPECATPGRMMAFLRSRNSSLDARFAKIAVEYMRHGEELGLRWDYTFYQMMLETGNLSFRDRGRRGDVKPGQNNFAGLGATGGGVSGESFPDVSTGVLAHLQHVLVYSGETVESPVAERTRKVQEWGILKSMQKRAKGSVTFAHLATKWAPGADYVSNLESIASRFEEGFCNAPDPNPEMVAEARGMSATAVASAPKAPAEERVSGAALARQAIADGKADGDDRRKGLGATSIAKGAAAAAAAAPTPSYSILNAPRPSQPTDTGPSVADAVRETERAFPGAERDRTPGFATASAAGTLGKAAPRAPAAKAPAEAAPAAGKCRVWTASYGGQKALIIRVRTEQGTDYTVLDVNEGAESREADAYIAAYAKGGAVEGEFASQSQALEKAFELCPES